MSDVNEVCPPLLPALVCILLLGLLLVLLFCSAAAVVAAAHGGSGGGGDGDGCCLGLVCVVVLVVLLLLLTATCGILRNTTPPVADCPILQRKHTAASVLLYLAPPAELGNHAVKGEKGGH